MDKIFNNAQHNNILIYRWCIILKMIKGLAAGTIIGAAIGMMVYPELDRKKQRQIRNAMKKMSCMAEDFYDDMMYKMK